MCKPVGHLGFPQPMLLRKRLITSVHVIEAQGGPVEVRTAKDPPTGLQHR